LSQFWKLSCLHLANGSNQTFPHGQKYSVLLSAQTVQEHAVN